MHWIWSTHAVWNLLLLLFSAPFEIPNLFSSAGLGLLHPSKKPFLDSTSSPAYTPFSLLQTLSLLTQYTLVLLHHALWFQPRLARLRNPSTALQFLHNLILYLTLLFIPSLKLFPGFPFSLRFSGCIFSISLVSSATFDWSSNDQHHLQTVAHNLIIHQ